MNYNKDLQKDKKVQKEEGKKNLIFCQWVEFNFHQVTQFFKNIALEISDFSSNRKNYTFIYLAYFFVKFVKYGSDKRNPGLRKHFLSNFAGNLFL